MALLRKPEPGTIAAGWWWAGRAFVRLRMLVFLTCAALLAPNLAPAEQVPALYKEGLVHGFLVLYNLAGETLADGELVQTARGDQVTSHLIFRFHDGSTYDETTTFSQSGSFRLLSDHLVHKGPAFEYPMDVTVDASTGEVTTRSTKDGKESVTGDHLDLPPDLANGILFTVLKNIRPDAGETKLSLLATTTKPRLVKLSISSQGKDTFVTGETKRKAEHFVAKVEIGGIAGAIAPLVGKQPPDIHIWILEGAAPVFVKSEGPLYPGGPVWRIELVGPTWPSSAEAKGK